MGGLVVLVTLETAVVVLLVVLVAGLLRSHADILRALHSLGARVGDPSSEVGAEEDGGTGAPAVPGPSPTGTGRSARLSAPVGRRAPDLVGVSPDGEAIGISAGGRAYLVAFLSSGCGTCAGFWQALSSGAADGLAPTRVLAVTRDPAEESASALARLAPDGVLGDGAVVMSSAAWDDYAVPGSPYFVYVDESGRVAGEGTASRWDQLVSLCRQARADAEETAGTDGPSMSDAGGSGRPGPRTPPPPAPWATDAEREARADRDLLAAGIHPGHPSLYPDRQP